MGMEADWYRSGVLLTKFQSIIFCLCLALPLHAQSDSEIETLEWPIHNAEKSECADLIDHRWGECAMSADCILFVVKERNKAGPFYARYGCRKAQTRCEQGFRQAVSWEEEKSGSTPESICSSKAKCAYIAEGPCWCPPETIKSCNCSGGSPPMCR